MPRPKAEPKPRAPKRSAAPKNPQSLHDLVDPADLADKDVREPRVIGPGFHEDVYAVVRLVPPGFVTTYGDVGTMLGSARIARQVGWALSSLPPTLTDVPWHRVINARGTVSFRGDLVRATHQETLLKTEGIVLDEEGRLDLEAHRFRYPGIAVPFKSRRPESD